jgi:DNA repair protein RecO (recombination protein O)
MPIVSTEGFVLRSYKLGEKDKIVVLFTREYGKIRFVAKGARKLKNRFGAALEVFAHVRATFHEKQNRDLLVLDRAEILYSPFEKQARLRTSYYLFYFAELIHEFYPEREKNPAGFRILLNVKRAIQNQQDLDFLARYVELQLLHSQGILSSVAFCSQCNRLFESLQERRYLGPGTEIFCKRCRGEDSVVLSTQIVRSFDHFEKGSTEWVKTLSGSTLEELGSLNHMLITRFLGKELQSYRFRKQLGG